MRELYADSINKSFGNRAILTDIFISCKPGDIIGLLGRNGSGKSTLLRIIFGSLKADQKYVKVNGKTIEGISQTKGKISYLPQHNFLPDHLRIRRIIALFCTASTVEYLRQHLHIKPFLHKKPKDLSGGERRMIEILLIINSGADFILMDEPFNGVEPLHKSEVTQLIKQESQNKGFIITDHDYKNILETVTKIILLHDGSTREIKTQDDLTDNKYLSNNAN